MQRHGKNIRILHNLPQISKLCFNMERVRAIITLIPNYDTAITNNSMVWQHSTDFLACEFNEVQNCAITGKTTSSNSHEYKILALLNTMKLHWSTGLMDLMIIENVNDWDPWPSNLSPARHLVTYNKFNGFLTQIFLASIVCKYECKWTMRHTKIIRTALLTNKMPTSTISHE